MYSTPSHSANQPQPAKNDGKREDKKEDKSKFSATLSTNRLKPYVANELNGQYAWLQAKHRHAMIIELAIFLGYDYFKKFISGQEKRDFGFCLAYAWTAGNAWLIDDDNGQGYTAFVRRIRFIETFPTNQWHLISQVLKIKRSKSIEATKSELGLFEIMVEECAVQLPKMISELIAADLLKTPPANAANTLSKWLATELVQLIGGLEIPAWIESGLMREVPVWFGVFSPDQQGKLMTQAMTEANLEKFANLAQPDLLAASGGQTVLLSKTNSYDEQMLCTLTKALIKFAQVASEKFVLCVNNRVHNISFGYDPHPQAKCFKVLNINYKPQLKKDILYLAHDAHHDIADGKDHAIALTDKRATTAVAEGDYQDIFLDDPNSVELLRNCILLGLFDQAFSVRDGKTLYLSPHSVFNVAIVARKDKEASLKPLIDQVLLSDPEVMKALDEITFERAIATNYRYSGPFDMSVYAGDEKLAQRVAKCVTAYLQENRGTVAEKILGFARHKHKYDGASAVHGAAQYNQAEMIKILGSLWTPAGAAMVDFNAENDLGLTPLMLAAQNGCFEAIQELMTIEATGGKEPAVRVNQKGRKGTPAFGVTAFHLIAQAGRVDSARLLLNLQFEEKYRHFEEKYHLNPTLASDMTGEAPIEAAVRNGHIEMVKLLLTARHPQTRAYRVIADEASEDRVVADTKEVKAVSSTEPARRLRSTLLIVAIENNQIKMLEYLLKFHPDRARVNARRQVDGATPLHVAARNNNAVAMRMLLAVCDEKNIPVALAGINGQLAAKSEDKDDKKSDTKKDVNRPVPLAKGEKAEQEKQGDKKEFASAEIDSITIRENDYGFTPLHLAARWDEAKDSKESTVATLLEMKNKDGTCVANFTLQSQEGFTAFDIAVLNNNRPALKRLLALEKKGVGVGDSKKMHPHFGNQTILMLAVRNGCIETVEELLVSGKATVNSQSERKTTAAHCAVDAGRNALEMFKMLDRHKADFNKRNQQGKTPIELVRRRQDLTQIVISVVMNRRMLPCELPAGEDSTLFLKELYKEAKKLKSYPLEERQQKLEELGRMYSYDARVIDFLAAVEARNRPLSHASVSPAPTSPPTAPAQRLLPSSTSSSSSSSSSSSMGRSSLPLGTLASTGVAVASPPAAPASLSSDAKGSADQENAQKEMSVEVLSEAFGECQSEEAAQALAKGLGVDESFAVSLWRRSEKGVSSSATVPLPQAAVASPAASLSSDAKGSADQENARNEEKMLRDLFGECQSEEAVQALAKGLDLDESFAVSLWQSKKGVSSATVPLPQAAAALPAAKKVAGGAAVSPGTDSDISFFTIFTTLKQQGRLPKEFDIRRLWIGEMVISVMKTNQTPELVFPVGEDEILLLKEFSEKVEKLRSLPPRELEQKLGKLEAEVALDKIILRLFEHNQEIFSISAVQEIVEFVKTCFQRDFKSFLPNVYNQIPVMDLIVHIKKKCAAATAVRPVQSDIVQFVLSKILNEARPAVPVRAPARMPMVPLVAAEKSSNPFSAITGSMQPLIAPLATPLRHPSPASAHQDDVALFGLRQQQDGLSVEQEGAEGMLLETLLFRAQDDMKRLNEVEARNIVWNFAGLLEQWICDFLSNEKIIQRVVNKSREIFECRQRNAMKQTARGGTMSSSAAASSSVSGSAATVIAAVTSGSSASALAQGSIFSITAAGATTSSASASSSSSSADSVSSTASAASFFLHPPR